VDLFLNGVRRLSQVSGVISTLLILISALVVCQMIFVRSVLGESSIWQTEFVTFALIAATFIGAPYILMTHGHVNVDLLPLVLPQRWRVILAFVASLVALAFCLVLFVNSIDWWYEAWITDKQTSSIWRARLWIAYLPVPVGMALLCLQYIADILALATGRAMPFGLKPEDRL
jgi:TRAP-type C4-dicarboxylate transport system permease small subunit